MNIEELMHTLVTEGPILEVPPKYRARQAASLRAGKHATAGKGREEISRQE